MIGVALVTFASIFAAGAKTTDRRRGRHNGSRPALVVQNTTASAPFSRGRRCGRSTRVPGVAGRRAVRFSTGQGRGPGKHVPVTGIDPASFTRLYGVDSSRAATDAARAGRPGDGHGRQELRRRQQPQGRRAAARVTTPTNARRALRVVRDLRRQGRPARPSSPSTTASCARDFGAAQGRASCSSASRPGTDAKVVERRVEGAARPRLPRGRGADRAGVQGPAGRPDQPAAGPDLRAAGAGHHRLAVRDRQHARALDQRAHARARDAAGHRDVARAGQADDPLRGGHHVADRRRAGPGAGRRPGGPLHPRRSTASCCASRCRS